VTLALSAPVMANPIFENVFDSSWSGTALATAQAAVTAAEGQLSSLFSNNVTLRIQFTSTVASGLADANFNVTNFPSPYGPSNFSYDQIVTDLKNHSAAHPENTALAATVAHLRPTISCFFCNTGFNQPPNFFLPDAESLALTGAPVPQATGGYGFEGFIRLNPNFTYDTNPADGIASTALDLTGIMLHEITHVMGRVDYAFAGTYAAADPFLTVLDLDRYTCGQTTLNFMAANACFSLDGGLTDLRTFSPTSDTGDWDSAVMSANNASINYGTVQGFQTADVLAMNALGWDPVVSTQATPEPATVALVALALGAVGFSRRRHSSVSHRHRAAGEAWRPADGRAPAHAAWRSNLVFRRRFEHHSA
jgi:hypothetical protein